MARYDARHKQICLTKPKEFIIPVLLSDELPPDGMVSRRTRSSQPTKRGSWVGGVGHWVLAVAQKINATVDIEISDSLGDNHHAHHTISPIVTSIVRNSEWMADEVPIFHGARLIEVAQQASGTNTCGVHVILNGWAYLLNITPCADRHPTLEQYDEATEL